MKSIWRKIKLKKTQDFQRIIKKKKRFFDRFFIVFFSKKMKKKNDNNYCKMGISIPQKLVKKSHQRNKWKRQIKNIIYQTVKDNNFQEKLKNWEFVIVLKKECLDLDFEKKKIKFQNVISYMLMKLESFK